MNLLIKMGKQIAKHKFLILLIGFLLLIPSLIGMVTTRVNYDLLSYLPETLETVKGQDIMVDESVLDGCCREYGTERCAES